VISRVLPRKNSRSGALIPHQKNICILCGHFSFYFSILLTTSKGIWSPEWFSASLSSFRENPDKHVTFGNAE
jgi:hypothetical protein